jgi:hypothetical protein
MDRLDEISKELKDGKRASEERVARKHTDGNQIVYITSSHRDWDDMDELIGLVKRSKDAEHKELMRRGRKEFHKK